MSPKRFFWSASLSRSIAEATTLVVAIIVGLAAVHEQLSTTALARGVLLGVNVAPVLVALRWRIPSGRASATLARESLAAVALTVATVASVVGLSAALGVLPVLDAALGGPIVTGIILSTTGPLYLGMRLIGVRTWLYWTRLRENRLIWGLVHAHLTVVVVAVLIVVTAASVFSLINGSYLSQNEPAPQGPLALGLSVIILAVFPAVWTAVVLGAIGIALVLPPSAMASFFVARRATGRLENLASATNRLRAGDYAVRVPVEGKDEVAQLQSGFNAMAADLERALTDLATERDRVAGLLGARRELVATVSHELRTPVAIIRGYVESSLQRGAGSLPPEVRADLETVDREADRLQRLIDDLFALSRVEAGQLALDCQPTNLPPVVSRIVQTMSPLAWQSGRVSVVAEPAEGDVPPALVDPSRLEQMLANLIHNAIRHTPPGGIVAVVIRAGSPGEVAIEVHDTGEGIADADLPHIFERFYRGEHQRDGDRGAGLGLALVKELAEAMGGRVSVSSQRGRGSVFVLILPSS